MCKNKDEEKGKEDNRKANEEGEGGDAGEDEEGVGAVQDIYAGSVRPPVKHNQVQQTKLK